MTANQSCSTAAQPRPQEFWALNSVCIACLIPSTFLPQFVKALQTQLSPELRVHRVFDTFHIPSTFCEGPANTVELAWGQYIRIARGKAAFAACSSRPRVQDASSGASCRLQAERLVSVDEEEDENTVTPGPILMAWVYADDEEDKNLVTLEPILMAWLCADEEEDVDIMTLDPGLLQEGAQDPDCLRHLPVHIKPEAAVDSSAPSTGAAFFGYALAQAAPWFMPCLQMLLSSRLSKANMSLLRTMC